MNSVILHLNLVLLHSPTLMDIPRLFHGNFTSYDASNLLAVLFYEVLLDFDQFESFVLVAIVRDFAGLIV